MKTLAVAAAMSLAMLAAGTELVRAEDGGEAVVAAKPPAASPVTPWETRETDMAAPTAEDRRAIRQVRYTGLINKYAAVYDIPVELAHAVIQIESNFRATVKGSAGEIGLMQVKPATARLMGYEGPAYGLYDPETNIRFGMKYLSGAQERGSGEVCSTILKYNAGHAAKRMNPVSQRYCNRVHKVLASMDLPDVAAPDLDILAFEPHGSAFLASAPLVF
jgi:soluble lytic murein transglycosylase-like protein